MLAIAVSACTATPPPSISPVVVIRQCDAGSFDPPATLTCDAAIDAALNSMAPTGSPVVSAGFRWALPCSPMGAPCPFAGQGDRGFVVVTTAIGERGLIRVQRLSTGTISAAPPEPYTPPTPAPG